MVDPQKQQQIDEIIRQLYAQGDLELADSFEREFARTNNIAPRNIHEVANQGFDPNNPPQDLIDSFNNMRNNGYIEGVHPETAASFPAWERGKPFPESARGIFDFFKDPGSAQQSNWNLSRDQIQALLPHRERMAPYVYQASNPQGAKGGNHLFSKPVETIASAPNAMIHKLTSEMQALPIPFPGQQIAPLGPQHELAKQWAIQHQQDVEKRTDPFLKNVEDLVTNNIGEREKYRGAFDEGAKAIAPEHLQNHLVMRGAMGPDEYYNATTERARKMFNEEIAPQIINRYAKLGRGFDTPSRDASINNQRQKFMGNELEKARLEYQRIHADDVREALRHMLAEKESRVGVAERSQAHQNSVTAGQGEMQRQHALGMATRDRDRQAAWSPVLANEREEQSRVQAGYDRQVREHEKAQDHMRYNQGLLANLAHGLPAPMVPASPPLPVGIAPSSTAASTLAGAASMLNPNAAFAQQMGGQQKLASGGTVHLPHQYTEQQLGMDHPDMHQAREMAQELGSRPDTAWRAYWSNIASGFDQKGGWGTTIANAHKASQEAENDRYNSKLVSSQVMQKIHDARLNQRKALMDFDRDKDQDLWKRSSDAQQLALEKRKVDLLEQKASKPSAMKLSDRKVSSEATQDIQDMDSVLDDIKNFEQVSSGIPEGGVVKSVTSNPYVLSKTGYGKEENLQRFNDLTEKVNNEFERVLQQDKSMSDKALKEYLDKNKLYGLSDDKKTRAKKIAVIRKHLEKKRNYSAGVLGSDERRDSPRAIESDVNFLSQAWDELDSQEKHYSKMLASGGR